MLKLKALLMALCAVIVLSFGVSEAQASMITETVNVEASFVRGDYVKVPVVRNTGPLAWLKHRFGKRGACLLPDLRDPSGTVIGVDQYRRYRFDYCLVPKSALSKIDEAACSRSRELIAQDRESVKSRKSSSAVIAKSDPPLVRSFEEKTDTPTLRSEDVKSAPEKIEKMEVPEPASRGFEAPAPVVTPSTMSFDTVRTVTLKLGEDNQVFTIKRGESIRFVLEGATEDATLGIWPKDESFIGWQQDDSRYGVFVFTGNRVNAFALYAQQIVLYPTNWVGKDAPSVKFRLLVV